jgi:hypothetical protein
MVDADSMGNRYVHKQKKAKWSEGDARIKMEKTTFDLENETGQYTRT